MKGKTTYFFGKIYAWALIFLVLEKFSSAANAKIHITKKSNKVKQRSRYTN